MPRDKRGEHKRVTNAATTHDTLVRCRIYQGYAKRPLSLDDSSVNYLKKEVINIVFRLLTPSPPPPDRDSVIIRNENQGVFRDKNNIPKQQL